MKLKINIIDAFTNEAFKGNSAAVVVLEKWLDENIMQNIASENNLSETAFLVKDEKDVYHIKWFSPLTEIDFCGHATLASSFVLFKDNEKIEKLNFYAKAVGEFEVIRKDNGFIQMDFPNRKPKIIESIPNEIIDGLSIKPKEVYLSQQAYFAIYENEEDVLSITYKKELLEKLAPYDVVVTSLSSNSKYDCISRYFWPANGGEEDPVTGSIHAGIAPYWAKVLNKNEIIAYQASKRGGVLYCKIKEDRVLISGQAVQYLEGYIEI